VVTPSILMSLRPRYAEGILSGTKTYELRRRKPSFPVGSRVVVYSSAPLQRLLGTFESGQVHEATPEGIWKLVSAQAGIDRAEFDAYFAGCDRAYAIEVKSPRRLAPRPLRFRPPQSYQFLHRSQRRHRTILDWVTNAA
jgi:predicted transcriptional regulator